MKLLKYSLIVLISISLFSCEKDDDTTEPTTPINNALIYLDANGVTIKASAAAIIGDTGTVNGILYTVVDSLTLRNRIISNADVTNVCVSRITDMIGMFYNASSFNQDISSWDVSNVTDMRSVFFGATSFNQDIGSWNVANVTDMFVMFQSANSFNQDIGTWNVSGVTNMRGMFYNNQSFDQNITSWNVSNVVNMQDMFYGASIFNQDLSSWSVSNVTQCTDFSLNTTAWTLPKPNFTNCNPN